jgi:septal ring-binding cell division protein DamX
VAGGVIGFVVAQFVAPPPSVPGPAQAAVAAKPPPATLSAPAATQPPPPEAVPVAATASAPAPKPAPAAQPPGATAPADADVVAARLAAGRELIAEGSPARFAVQLMVTDAREKPYLSAYLAEASKSLGSERLYVVPTAGADAPRVAVLYGPFKDRDEASAALGSLPEALRQFRPFVRSVDGVREDARRVASR